MTLYEELGIAPDATPSQIKAAYRAAASRAHPDRPGGSHERMARANLAIAVLGDDDARKRYDETGLVDEEPSLQQQAESTFMQMLAEALGQDTNPLWYIRRLIDQSEQKINHAVVKINLNKQKLSSIHFHYKGKGKDCAKMLLAQRTASLVGQLKEAEEAKEILTLVAAILADYTP